MDPFILKFHNNLDVEDWVNRDIFYIMGNIGSEVSRTIKWRNKDKRERSVEKFSRSLELFDLSIHNKNITSGQLGELLRAREVWCDFIFGDNEYNSTDNDIQNYFDQFALAYYNINR